MTIKIQNMRKSGRHNGLADFDATIGEWQINACVIVENEGCGITPLPPFVAKGVRSVRIPQAYWFDFINSAREAYTEFQGSQPKRPAVSAGVRRMLGLGELEALEIAGL